LTLKAILWLFKPFADILDYGYSSEPKETFPCSSGNVNIYSLLHVTFTSEDPFDDINSSVDLQADVTLDPILLKNSIKVELPISKHTLTSQLIKQLQLLTKMPMDAK